MKKKVIALLLVFVFLLSDAGIFATPAVFYGDEHGDKIHITDFATLEEYLSSKEPADLILDKDLEYQNSLLDDSTVKSFYINGLKTLDLNGHRLSVKYEVYNGNQALYPKNTNGIHIGTTEQYYNAFKKNEYANNLTAFVINRGSRLLVFDSSKDQEGQIIAHRAIEFGTFHETNGVETVYNDSECTDAFHVENGGSLKLYSGAIVAGRSKQYWLTTAHDIKDLDEYYTGNGRIEKQGTGVLVKSGGSFDCYGGRVAGRGYEKVYLNIEFCTTEGFMGTVSDSVYSADIEGRCAAVRALNGSRVNIYDGQLTGNTGANVFDIEDGADVKVYSGYFNTTRQEHSIISKSLSSNLPYKLQHGCAYAQELFYDTGYGSVGLKKENFAYGDDLIEIYEGKEKKESKRVTLKMQKTADDSSSEDGSTSAGITLVSGKSKININRKYSPYDGKAHSYLVCPASAQVFNFTQVTDAVSYTESKMEYAKDTHCKLKVGGQNLFFPAGDDETEGYLEHSLGDVSWKVTRKGENDKWVKLTWGNRAETGENINTVDLSELLKDCEVGDIFRIEAKYTEFWESKNDYAISRVLVTPEITVVDHDLLCEHDFDCISDTHTCNSPGIAISVCKKCGEMREEEVPADEKHQLIRRYDSKECWDECLICHQTFNKKAHVIEDLYNGKKGPTTEIVKHSCRNCDFSYTDYKESTCQHEFSINYTFYDEKYHWSYCNICGECFKDVHHHAPIDSEAIGCLGSDINGSLLPCLYFRLTDSEEISGGSFINYVDGQYIELPRIFCTHKELNVDFSHLNADLRNKSKTYEWTIEYSEAPDKKVTGKSSLNLADYVIKNDRILCVYVKVTVGGKVFSTESTFPIEVEIDGYDATCSSTGAKHHWVCPGCMQTVDSKEDTSKVIDVTIPKNNKHVYDNDCDDCCNNCGFIREAPHDWKVTTDASGNTVPVYEFHNINEHAQHCSKCKAVRDVHVHDWKETVIKEGNCSEYGILELTCDTCNYTVQGTTPVKGDHVYEIVSETPETCETDGSVTYKCKVCGDTYTDTLAKLDHIPAFAQSFIPSCLSPGKIEHFECPMCNTAFADEAGEKLLTVEEITIPEDKNVHDEISDYEIDFNTTHHWCTCECGTVAAVSEHTYGEDGSCTECGYVPDKDLVLSEEAKKAGASIIIMETPNVGDAVPVITAPQGQTFKMFMSFYWWVILVGVLVIGLAVTAIILIRKYSAAKKLLKEKDAS